MKTNHNSIYRCVPSTTNLQPGTNNGMFLFTLQVQFEWDKSIWTEVHDEPVYIIHKQGMSLSQDPDITDRFQFWRQKMRVSTPDFPLVRHQYRGTVHQICVHTKHTAVTGDPCKVMQIFSGQILYQRHGNEQPNLFHVTCSNLASSSSRIHIPQW